MSWWTATGRPGRVFCGAPLGALAVHGDVGAGKVDGSERVVERTPAGRHSLDSFYRCCAACYRPPWHPPDPLAPRLDLGLARLCVVMEGEGTEMGEERLPSVLGEISGRLR